MSVPLHCRVSDEIYESIKGEVAENGVSITDVVTLALVEHFGKVSGGVICHVEQAPSEKPKVSKKVEDIVPEILPDLAAKKVASGGYFRPMPKDYALRNAGKEGKKKR